MFIKNFALTVSVLIGLLMIPGAYAQDTRRPLYIIFDGSNSMWGELPDKSRKIETAKRVFEGIDNAWFESRDVALRLYGHRRAKDCSDTELAVPFVSGQAVKSRLAAAIEKVKPRGKTPISRSLQEAFKDFNGRGGEILLISDGIETCDADPCELVESWRENNIDIRVHVVGLGLNDLARSAMQCISDASGTPYLDANNVGELFEAIESAANAPVILTDPEPKPEMKTPEFKISGQDEYGNFLPVKGSIFKAGMEPVDIESNTRYVFDGGQYTIEVGVPTVNGLIYKPVSKIIEIQAEGTTKVNVTLTRPPTVRTKFIQAGEEVRGAGAYSYVNDVRGFVLRPNEDYFLMPGNYEFRANLRTDNSDLRTMVDIVDGDDKDIVFELITTVHTTFHVINKDTGKRLRQHQELWQAGQKKYQIHYANGAKIQPGSYTLKSPSVMTSYVIERVDVPAVDKQILEFEVQLGRAQIHYRVKQKNPEKPDVRCWLYHVDEHDVKSSHSSRMQRCDGRDIYLSEGRYYVYTTKTFGKFKDTYFNVIAGESTEVEVFLE